MLSDRFLMNRWGASLTRTENQAIDNSISVVRNVEARAVIVRAHDKLSSSTLLLDGLLCRYMDDRRGLRQLVALHVPGDFVDLHGYPLGSLDHDIAALTTVRIAIVPHRALDGIVEEMPALTRKLWYSTLLDAAMHRAWLFRLGRLDAIGRVVHFLSETHVRLKAVGLSEGNRFPFGITQTDLAEICGLTSVHVNRVLRDLRESGLCTFRSGMVEILDRASLAQRGEFDPA